MNQNRNLLTGVFLIVFLGLTSGLSAQKNSFFSSSSVPFLRIAPDARAAGMGDQGVATTADANAAFWNLGKAVFNEERSGLSASYSPWMRGLANDISFASLGGYHKLDEDQALTIAFRYFNLGDIQFTSDGRDDLGSFRPREMALSLGYSRLLSERLGLGLSVNYINSALANGVAAAGMDYKTGRAVAASLGLFYDQRDDYGDGFLFGASLSNLGSKISYSRNSDRKDFLPANLGLGTSWNKVLNEMHQFSIGFELNKLLIPALDDTSALAVDKYHQRGVAGGWLSSFSHLPGLSGISLGAEYWYNQLFALRAGYFTETSERGGRNYLTAGLGLKYSGAQFNFSYLNAVGQANPAMNNTLRFSIAFNFGEKSSFY